MVVCWLFTVASLAQHFPRPLQPFLGVTAVCSIALSTPPLFSNIKDKKLSVRKWNYIFYIYYIYYISIYIFYIFRHINGDRPWKCTEYHHWNPPNLILCNFRRGSVNPPLLGIYMNYEWPSAAQGRPSPRPPSRHEHALIVLHCHSLTSTDPLLLPHSH